MPTQDRSSAIDTERLVLLAAHETGALDALATTTGTPEGVARETGLDERAARLLVEALAERGFLRRLDDEYQPTNRMLGFLTKTDIRSIGRLPHELDALSMWRAFPDIARGDRPEQPPDWLRNELGSRAADDDARVRGAVTAAHRAHPDASSVLCVGDGPGRHAVEFAARGFDVTLLDRSEVVDVATPALEHEAVTVVAGDPLDHLPPADIVFGAGVLSRHDPTAARQLLSVAREAVDCRRDAVATFVDHVGGSTSDAALRSLDAYVRYGGMVHDGSDLRSWCDEVGFATSELVDIPGDERWVLVARGSRS